MTTLEVKDSIAELIPSCDELQSLTQKNHPINDLLLPQIEELNRKFEHQNSRIDRLELDSKQLKLHEDPQTIQYKSLKEYVRKGHFDDLEQKSIGNSESLAYLIPREISMYIDKCLSRNSIMRKLCSVEKISGDSLEYFITNNKDTFVGWGEEDTAVKDDTHAPQISRTTIQLYELYSQPQIAKKLLDDSLIDLEKWLIDHLVDAFSRKENEAFISGDGNNKPLGILSHEDGTDNTQIERVTVKKLDSDAIIKLYYSLDEYFASRGAFIMHRSVLQEIRSLKSSSGQYLLQAGTSGEELLLGIASIPNF